MHNVYWLPDLEFSEDFVGQAVEQVPEVVLWELEFIRKRGRHKHRSHLLDELRVRFVNGRTLTIDGPYLWKFRDSIPPQFGSEEGGYLADNPFCEGSLESLLRNLRAAHDRFFIPMSEDASPAPPLTVRIDTRIQRIETDWAYQVPESVQRALRTRLARHFQRIRPAFETMLADTLKTLVNQGQSRFRMEEDPENPGLLRNRLHTRPWTEDVYVRTLGEMLSEIDPRPDDPHGPTPKLHDRLRDWVESQGDAWFKGFAERRDGLCYVLSRALGWTGFGTVAPEELLSTLRDSDCPDLPADVLWGCVERGYADKTVAELVKRRGH